MDTRTRRFLAKEWLVFLVCYLTGAAAMLFDLLLRHKGLYQNFGDITLRSFIVGLLSYSATWMLRATVLAVQTLRTTDDFG